MPREFLSTLSLRRATFKPPIQTHGQKHFYPRSPCGERPGKGQSSRSGVGFLSTLSLRRATQWEGMKSLSEVISIHALLAESDHNRGVNLLRFKHFYPRSPCGERPKLLAISVFIHTFLSTLSLRRATLFALLRDLLHHNFYPRSPCGERRSGYLQTHRPYAISIHALLAESDGASQGAAVGY